MPDQPEDYVDFFFGAPQSAAELQTLEISQPSFSQVWRLQSHYREGFYARLETGEQAFFQYVPMRLKPLEERANLDFGLTVILGDLGEILPDEIQRARTAGTLRTNPPVVKYRAYRTDNLESPMFGPVSLQARQIARSEDGAKFNAMAPEANANKTGILYRSDVFPMLLGFL
ncbi:DUF1833 family protein [Achromobacter insolitus]|uniref:DUF1833 family protein n=1 Tax=Achromobacter insolitus TaxID=217204 RepID=UPI002FE0D79F